jgi:hypothetical protein
MVSMTFSPELTYFPKRAPYEITDRKAGEKLAKRISKALYAKGWMLPLRVELDPARNVHLSNKTYHIEIVPLFQFECHWLDDGKEWTNFKRVLAHIFDTCKANGLVPAMVKHRGGEEQHYPGGGCHLHLDMGELFTSSQAHLWYKRMETFHRNLLMDFANRPYIRWLFSHWFADAGSSVMLRAESPLLTTSERNADGSIKPYDPLEEGCSGASVIEPRFMQSNKRSYLTFEMRVFSMVESPDEVRLIARFAKAWMDRIKTITLPDCEYYTTTHSIPLDLTLDKLADMKDPMKARAMCASFIQGLGLEWGPYSVFFKRNYLRRIQWGAFV